MINITKQGNNVIVTSDNPNSFHIGNGELSVPLNTIYYVLDDESDFIQFNSTEKGKILFNGTIGDIQVNGNIVNRENILMELDNVFNSAATGGEGGTAGVLSINGYDGYINLKSINGQSLIGSGNIEISGGEIEQYIKMLGEEYNNNLIWYMNQSDDYKEIKFKTINGNQIMGEGDITVEGGGSVTETDPVFTEWKDGSSISLGSGSVASTNNEYGGVAIGINCETNDGIALGNYCSSYNGIVIGKYSYDNNIENCVIIGNDLVEASNDTYVTNINDVLRGDADKYAYILNEYREYVRIPTEWTGTQSEYDALGEYYDNITYYIIED